MRLIDGDRLDDVLEDFCFDYNGESDFNVGVRNGVLIAKDIVQGAPTIDAEPVRHGKWIKENIVLTILPPKSRWHCSRCGAINDGYDESVLTPYCPNCGAKMDEEESHEADISGND